MVTLIVDDIPEMRELVQTNLELVYPHMSFIHASNGVKGCELLERYDQQVSLVVCDFNMPGGNGDLVFRLWQKSHYHIPFVMFTSEIKAARLAVLNGEKNLWQRLSFLEKDATFESLPKVISRIVPKSFIKVPLNWFQANLPLNYPIFITLGDKKIIQYAHEGSSLELSKIEELKAKGAKSFLIPMEMAFKNKLKWPQLYLQGHHKNKSPSLLSAFDNFRVVHEDLVTSHFINREKFSKACEVLSDDLTRFIKSDIFRLYEEKGLTVKNYVLNHSFLIALLSSLFLEELGLNSRTCRMSLVEGCLFHDLFKNDLDAYSQDLLEREYDVKKYKNALMQLLTITKDLGFSRDSEHIIEGLFLHRLPLGYLSGNHKLARVARLSHLIVSDFYKNSFVMEAGNKDISSYDDDPNLIKAMDQIFL